MKKLLRDLKYMSNKIHVNNNINGGKGKQNETNFSSIV